MVFFCFFFIKLVAEYVPTPKPRKLVKSTTVEPVLFGIPKRKAPSPLSEDRRLSPVNSAELVVSEQSVANILKSLDEVLNDSSKISSEEIDQNFNLDNPPKNIPIDIEKSNFENEKSLETEKVSKQNEPDKNKSNQDESNKNKPNHENEPNNLTTKKPNKLEDISESKDNDVIKTNLFSEQTTVNWETPVTKSNEIDFKERSCKIISTIPKCDHFDCIDISAEDLEISNHYSNNDFVNKSETDKSELIEKTEREMYTNVDLDDKKTWRSLDNERQINKRVKIFRSQSELSNFEINTPERPGRHLTSHAEDFMCALNTNLSANITDLSATSSRFDKSEEEKFSIVKKEEEETQFQFSDNDLDCQRILEKLREDVKLLQLSQKSGACRCFY